MKSLRQVIRKLILESVKSNAKGVQHLIPGTHVIKINGNSRGVSLHMYADSTQIFRMTIHSSDNSEVYQVGAAYVEDERADGFGPMMYDMAMEYTTKVLGKWLTADRSTCSEDAQKVWQFYLDNRIGDGIKSLQLDDRMNIMTPGEEDNIDTRMADEVLMGFGSGYWSADNQKEYQRDFYTGNGMMHAYKKEPEVINAALELDGVLQIDKW